MPPEPIWPQLLLQVVLIGINAFFASAEIAIITLNENILRRNAENGDKRAERLLTIVRMPTRFLSSIQIGITLAGFLGSAFAAENFASRITNMVMQHGGTLPFALVNTVSVVVVTIILSFFTLIFGELVPKRIAMQKSDEVARMAASIISAVSTVMSPIVFLLSAATNAVLRVLRIDPDAVGDEVSEDEIRLMVDIGEEKGAIEANEKEMIENIFEFNNMSAEDVMVHRTDVVAVWIEETPEDVVSMIEETGLSRFPVYEEDMDDIVGVLSTREYLLNARRENPKPFREIIRPAYFVPKSVRTDVLFRDMQSKKVHIAIVVDEYGGTSGVVTMEDLLEEIVGNIYDEFDPQDELDAVQLEENLWRISGSTDLETLAEIMDIELPEEEMEYDTLGGLVFSMLSVIPEDGSKIDVETWGLHIRVEELNDRRVEWALVSRLEAKADKGEN